MATPCSAQCACAAAAVAGFADLLATPLPAVGVVGILPDRARSSSAARHAVALDGLGRGGRPGLIAAAGRSCSRNGRLVYQAWILENRHPFVRGRFRARTRPTLLGFRLLQAPRVGDIRFVEGFVGAQLLLWRVCTGPLIAPLRFFFIPPSSFWRTTLHPRSQTSARRSFRGLGHIDTQVNLRSMRRELRFASFWTTTRPSFEGSTGLKQSG